MCIRDSIEPKQNYEGITDEPNFENALEIMTPLVQEFYEGKTNQIEIVYTEYQSARHRQRFIRQYFLSKLNRLLKKLNQLVVTLSNPQLVRS